MTIADVGAEFERPDTGIQVQATDAVTEGRAATVHASPVRRYVARFIDETIELLVLFLILVVLHALRLPLEKGFFLTLLTLTTTFVGHIALAASMSVFGNTPGKYMTGIRVKPIEGEADFEFYLRREMAFFVHADALTIPVAGAVMSVFQCVRLQNTGFTTYDQGKAVVVRERSSALRYLWLAPALAVAMAVVPVVLRVSMKIH